MSPRIISNEDFVSREVQLIEIGRQLVERGTIGALTIDSLVAAAPYSKGTIYKHFTSKEDLILAICNTCVTELGQMFERALTFNGSNRERMVAVVVSYLIWAKLHPSQLFTVLSAHSPTVASCSSPCRNEAHHDLESGLMGLFNDEIAKAIAAGDLSLPSGMHFEQVTFAVWSSIWGAMALIISKGTSVKLQPMVLEREAFMNTQLILDGFGWKPLSKDWDYASSIRRIATELFQTEIKSLDAMGSPFIFA